MEEMSKLTVDEMGCPSNMPKQDHDHEGRMHRSSLFKMAKYSVELLDMIQDADDLPEWVESKITKAADYLGVVKHYLEADDAREMGALEESKSERKDQDIEEINQIMMTRMQPREVEGLLMILQRDYGHTTPLEEVGFYRRASDDFDAGVSKYELGDMGKRHKAERAAAKSKKDKEELAAALARLKANPDSYVVGKKRKRAEEQISEDMIEDVFAEVNENFTIYDTVQDAITEDGEHACPQCLYEVLSDAACGCPDLVPEAEYRGRKVKLNKPMRGDVKKFKVFVKDPKTGNIKKVNFGDPNMRIKKSNPKRRKSFRARHNCKNPGPKTKARYWSCRKW